jgi:hypothetical protein
VFPQGYKGNYGYKFVPHGNAIVTMMIMNQATPDQAPYRAVGAAAGHGLITFDRYFGKGHWYYICTLYSSAKVIASHIMWS